MTDEEREVAVRREILLMHHGYGFTAPDDLHRVIGHRGELQCTREEVASQIAELVRMGLLPNERSTDY